MKWTHEQSSVITAGGQNLLVSAAAGSGKTAVLVERIMHMLTDPEKPRDIDRLLIVTFTKAAAGEMKERILKRLTDEREADPGNEHLARQLTLIHHAHITTIDGFCSYIVRSYAHTAGLSPDFRVAGEGELKLLMHDTAGQVINEAYEAYNAGSFPEFGICVDTLTPDKTDDRIEALLLKLYTESQSHPDPDGWLQMCAGENGCADPAEMENTSWMRDYVRSAAGKAWEGARYALRNVEISKRPDGPSAYLKTAEAEYGLLKAAAGSGGYEEKRLLITESPIPVLSRARPKAGEDPALRDVFKKNRAEVTKAVKALREMFRIPLASAFEELRKSRLPVSALVQLTTSFAARYAEEKQRRGIMEFSDLEHAALRILRTGDGARTEEAGELAASFDEVMVDEYQDSNYLQEAILTAVSRIEDGQPNYFCVGDVRQSIYSFRQARPDLFMKKYEEYPAHPEEGRRIDLHRNFRSRREVVDAVNGVFRQIMRKETGGIQYDDDAELVQGADYRLCGTEEGGENPYRTELMLVCTGERDEEGERVLGDEVSRTKLEAEARAIGRRILELTAAGTLEDEETHRARRIGFRDIVILVRSVSGTADVFSKVLTSMKIPVYAQVRGGYFDAPEVRTVLSFLSVLDNPQDDIALTAVLHSPFASFSAEELALIRTVPGAADWTGSEDMRYVSMYDALRRYASAGGNAALASRAADFLAFYESLLHDALEEPLHRLVYRLVTESGYLDYVSAMPGGAQRTVNLTLLIDKAAEFERTSYVGLFNFVRYIRNLRKQESDPDEPGTTEEGADAVRITTIHKSKGLEYPVVILAGTARRFNRQDLNTGVVVHPELGAAADYVDPVRRVKRPTLFTQAVRQRMKRDSAGEELRVLYVAMTRARQKLIISGCIRDEDSLAERDLMVPLREVSLPAAFISGAACFLDWLLPAVLRMNRRAEAEGAGPAVDLRLVMPTELIIEEARAQEGETAAAAVLRSISPETVFDASARSALRERFTFRYLYEGRENIPVELSVSELKHRASVEAGPDEGELGREAQMLYEPERVEPCVPAFIREKREEAAAGEGAPLSGAARGTACHRVMELLDFEAAAFSEGGSPEAVAEEAGRQMALFEETGRLGAAERASVSPSDVALFAMSPLGRRMAEAKRRGKLRREQPFVLEERASAIRPEWPDDEQVFVQGIVDAFFYEDDGIVLLDYKTDRVAEASELVRRYRIQLESYGEALEKASGMPVKERWIWSFHLGTAIIL